MVGGWVIDGVAVDVLVGIGVEVGSGASHPVPPATMTPNTTPMAATSTMSGIRDFHDFCIQGFSKASFRWRLPTLYLKGAGMQGGAFHSLWTRGQVLRALHLWHVLHSASGRFKRPSETRLGGFGGLLALRHCQDTATYAVDKPAARRAAKTACLAQVFSILTSR
jgi:hypothetical protein